MRLITLAIILSLLLVLLGELVDAQIAEAALRRTELALNALEARTRAITRLEARVRELKSMRASMEQNRERMVAEIESIEDGTAGMPADSGFKAMAEQNVERFEREIEVVDAHLASIESELSEADLRLLDAERGIERLEELVEAGLGSL